MKIKVIIIAAIVLVLAGAFLLMHGMHRQRPRVFKAAKKKAAKVIIPRQEKKARVAIVMDDFGNNMNDFDTLFSINQPITLSILPDLRYSRQVAQYARERGYEVILHLPLEPHRKDIKEEAETIRSGMSESEINSRLAKGIESIPGLTGVSNHMGSKATEDRSLMTTIFRHLKKERLYFFDSLTSEKSICGEAARAVNLRYAKRDMFLDNTDKVEYVENQLIALERIALRRGGMTAICHDRKNTITALAVMMPKMAKDGIEFVTLSEMVR